MSTMKGSSPDPCTSVSGLTNTNTPIAGDGTQLQAGAQPFRPPPPFSLTAESAAPPHRYEPPSFGAAKRPAGGTSPPPHTYSPGVPSYGSGSKASRPLLNNSMGHMGTPNSVPPVQGKFKTEMCRNWELMGQCTYRGCTYAHGPDDLRQAPMAYDGYGRGIPNPPAGGQQGRYPNQQAPMYQGGDSNQGSTHTTPVGGARQSTLSRSAPQPISASAPTVASEQIIDMILVEVRHERDDLLQQVNASKQLEADLRREQRRRQAVVRTQRALEGVLQMLKQEINERTRLLNEVLRAKGEYDFEAVLDDVMDSEEEAREEHHRGLDSDEDDDYHREDTNEFQDAHHTDPYASHHNKYNNNNSNAAPNKAPASNVWGNTGMGTVTSSSTLMDFDLQALDDLIEGGSSASGSSTSPKGRGSHRGQQGRGTGRGGASGSQSSKTTTGQTKPSAWGEPRGGRGGSGRGGSGRGAAAAPKRR